VTYRRAVALNREHPTAWNNLGVVLAKRGQHAAALEAFQNSMRISRAVPEACANARRTSAILGLDISC
jgi:Flp pilus assembly protein TadD